MMKSSFFFGMGTRRRITVLAILLMLSGPTAVFADTIVLKSGRKIDVEMAWVEDGQVKGLLSGVEVMYPQSAVERIDQTHPETATEVERQDGFRFGMWISGMRLADVRQLAETHDIALSSGRLPGPDRYAAVRNPPPHQAESIAFHYPESLLERPAEVEMEFTPVGEILYGLTVRWMGTASEGESDFFKKVYSNLSQKYGRHDQKESKLLSMTYRWNIGKRSWVNLESGVDAIEIRYVDTQFEKTAAAEHPAPP
jgi:hypothetical protein